MAEQKVTAVLVVTARTNEFHREIVVLSLGRRKVGGYSVHRSEVEGHRIVKAARRAGIPVIERLDLREPFAVPDEFP